MRLSASFVQWFVCSHASVGGYSDSPNCLCGSSCRLNSPLFLQFHFQTSIKPYPEYNAFSTQRQPLYDLKIAFKTANIVPAVGLTAISPIFESV